MKAGLASHSPLAAHSGHISYTSPVHDNGPGCVFLESRRKACANSSKSTESAAAAIRRIGMLQQM